MADSKEICKKRKRPSFPATNRLTGIFTRSKSQIHVHYNRSGKSRTGSVGPANLQDLQLFVKKHKNRSPAEGSLVGCDLSSVSIKDLRLRRVFSHYSTDGVIPNCLDDTENLGKSGVAGNCFDGSQEDCENGDSVKLDMPNGDFMYSTDGVIPNCLDNTESLGKSEVAGNCFDGSQEDCENGDSVKLDMPNGDFMYSTDGVIPNCLDDTESLGKSEVAGNCFDGSQEDCENGDSVKLDMPNEDFMFSTDGVIPDCLDDTENLGKSEVAGNCFDGSQEDCENGDSVKLDMPNEDFMQSTPPDAEIFGGAKQADGSESLPRHDRCSEKGFHEERNGMNYSIKSVLKPCSRVKLFKTPGSFSYRRLLPYLMDIDKDCSRSSIKGNCQKTEKGLEEKQLLASNGQQALGDKSMASCCFLEGYNSDSAKELNTVDSLTSQENESSSMPLGNGEIRKFELQVSCQDPNLNCLKHDSSSTIEDSHFNKEKSTGMVSIDKMLADEVDVAKTNVESPCNAQSLEVLDQVLPTVSDKRESCDHNEVTQHSNDDTKHPEIEFEGVPKATICGSFETLNLNSVDPTLSETGGNEVVEQVEDLSGQCVSLTPPDSDMFRKSKPDDHAIEKSINESFHRNNGQDSDKSLDTSLKNKLVPNSRLHLKLSKITGSFSYRRLLPFLIDITNDYSCASGHAQSLKVGKSSKEKPVSPFFTSGQGTCIKTVSSEISPVEHYNCDGIRLPVTALTATGCSSNDKSTQSPPKQVTGSPWISDSRQEPASLVKNAALDPSQMLDTSSENLVEPPAMSSSLLIDSGLFPSEEGAKSVSYQLPFETEVDVIKSTVKRANHEKQIEADSFLEASNPPGFPTACLRKGILKRNPRGCRGICTCLNCSSFRLHAERSFEFSRNQMQDAEEVALDLIKELSFLRNILEKSAHGVKDQTSLCINQVKEACKKASEAEELAKTRLGQMNYDLNIHCRIPCGQRPSVRFANYVEEQVIPIADLSNK